MYLPPPSSFNVNTRPTEKTLYPYIDFFGVATLLAEEMLLEAVPGIPTDAPELHEIQALSPKRIIVLLVEVRRVQRSGFYRAFAHACAGPSAIRPRVTLASVGSLLLLYCLYDFSSIGGIQSTIADRRRGQLRGQFVHNQPQPSTAHPRLPFHAERRRPLAPPEARRARRLLERIFHQLPRGEPCYRVCCLCSESGCSVWYVNETNIISSANPEPQSTQIRMLRRAQLRRAQLRRM